LRRDKIEKKNTYHVEAAHRGNRWAASPPSRGFRRGPAASHALCARWPLICGPGVGVCVCVCPCCRPSQRRGLTDRANPSPHAPRLRGFPVEHVRREAPNAGAAVGGEGGGGGRARAHVMRGQAWKRTRLRQHLAPPADARYLAQLRVGVVYFGGDATRTLSPYHQCQATRMEMQPMCFTAAGRESSEFLAMSDERTGRFPPAAQCADPGRSKRARSTTFSPPRRWDASPLSCCAALKPTGGWPGSTKFDAGARGAKSY
jgi:hypothetical protein